MPLISVLHPREIPEALLLVEETFRATFAPEFSQEGMGVFPGLLDNANFRRRQATGSVSYAAKDGNLMIGLLEVREKRHILLLFVKSGFQSRGIGRALIVRYLRDGTWTSGDAITVNAAPGSEMFYGRIGFAAKEEWRVRTGIRYLAMERVM